MKIEAPPIIYRPTPIIQQIPVTETAAPRVAQSRVNLAYIRVPRVVPTGIPLTDAPDVAGPTIAIPGTPGGIPTNINNLFSSLPQPTAVAPPARAETPTPPTAPVRVSTSIQSALLIFGPKPVYPPLARAARVQGTVRLTAVIGTDGTIRNLKLISGPPLLVATSVQAVQQWRYKPTMLNGSPVEVITEIDVNFTLGQ